MPKSLKIFLILSFLFVSGALLKNVFEGRAYSTTHGVLKLSGISSEEELGIYMYRQLYPQFLQAPQIIVSAASDIEFNPQLLLQGLNNEAGRLNHPRFLWSTESEKREDRKSFEFVTNKNLFRIRRFQPKNQLPKEAILIHVDHLINPDDLGEFPKECFDKEVLFSFPCVQQTISMKVARKWEKIEACTRVTLDQVEKKSFLLLMNKDDCLTKENE